MADLSTLSVHDQRSENRGRKSEIKGAESAPGSVGKIPPLAEVIPMHFAVAFRVSIANDADSFSYFPCLLTLCERGRGAILARRFSLRLVRAKDRVLPGATRFLP
jgi:hypothetical protein